MTVLDFKESPPISPIDAVYFTWSMSKMFSQHDQDKNLGLTSQTDYKLRLSEFDKRNNKNDSIYLGVLKPAIDTALANISTYIKHRDDQFNEAEKLRDDQINAIMHLDQFALNFQTAFPKIASSAAIAGITGLSLKNIFVSTFHLDPQQINLLYLSLLGVGYLVTELIVSPIAAWVTKKYIKKYNNLKNDYYNLYIKRCKEELNHLFQTSLFAYKIAYGSEYVLSVVGNSKWSIDDVLPAQESHIERNY
jgi:hypothetical protein